MRILIGAIAVAVFVVSTSTAVAQPGQTPPPPPPGYGQPYPVPMQALSPEERALLEKGEYTEGQIVGGGLLGTFFGLGIGHAVQGRFKEKGWIFLVGEAAGAYVWIWTMANCLNDIDDDRDRCNEGLLVTSILAVGVLRIWEIVDVWAHPGAHNRRVRQLRNRLYQQQGPYYPQPRWGVFAAPGKEGGGVAGVMVRF